VYCNNTYSETKTEPSLVSGTWLHSVSSWHRGSERSGTLRYSRGKCRKNVLADIYVLKNTTTIPPLCVRGMASRRRLRQEPLIDKTSLPRFIAAHFSSSHYCRLVSITNLLPPKIYLKRALPSASCACKLHEHYFYRWQPLTCASPLIQHANSAVTVRKARQPMYV
jgi:hypothetical protein